MRTRRSHHRHHHHHHPTSTILLTTLFLLSPLPTTASTYDCTNIRINQQSWDLSALTGPHSISHISPNPPTKINTTITLDICKPLKRQKHIDKDEQCPHGTRVCAIKHVIEKDGTSAIEGVIPVAGDYPLHSGRSLDANWEVLKSKEEGEGEGNHDEGSGSGSGGLRVTLHGGQYPFNSKGGRKQVAVIEFVCDRDRTGLEGLEGDTAAVLLAEKGEAAADDDGDNDDDEGGDTPGHNDDDDDDDKDNEKENKKSLRFISYGPTTSKSAADTDTLRLQWRTKHACKASGSKDDDDKTSSPKPKGNHWGFFTWLVIIVFLTTATYLIFGSWLNYNRYGARGWDLLPHSDTIRDIPYLMKDFTRRVVNTVSSGGVGGGASRGGYSAV